MTVSNNSNTLLDIFKEFLNIRKQEWKASFRLHNLGTMQLANPSEELFALRIEQAESYAELQLYKTYELYEELEFLFQKELIDKNVEFAAFVISERGIPSLQLQEAPEISDALIQWIFRNKRSLESYDFRFSDFEEAYKEACWRRFVDAHISLT